VCYESFGWPTLESFAKHTPVIVHDLGGPPEVVRSGGGGLTYQTNEELIAAMEVLRTQPELRRKLGEEAYRSYLDHYAEERHLAAYFSLIEERQAARAERGAA
jgi:glycosyltransferase involved in cell wall biosynthesis